MKNLKMFLVALATVASCNVVALDDQIAVAQESKSVATPVEQKGYAQSIWDSMCNHKKKLLAGAVVGLASKQESIAQSFSAGLFFVLFAITGEKVAAIPFVERHRGKFGFVAGAATGCGGYVCALKAANQIKR